MSIAAIEQHLIDTVKARFTTSLRAVESLPSDWDADTFNRLLRGVPGVFVVFGGGQPDPASNDDGVILAQWVLIAATAHASGELARRRGDSREIGAYEIIEILTQLLDGHDVPDAGRMKLQEIDNLFTGAVEKQGAAIYGVRFELPMPLAPSDQVPPTLDDFLTFQPDYDAAPSDGQLEAEDLVTLPQ